MSIDKTTVQVFCGGPEGYSKAFTSEIQSGQWQCAKSELPMGVGDGPLRIDIADRPSLIDIAAITLRNPADNNILWTANHPRDIGALKTGEGMQHLSSLSTALIQPKFSRYAAQSAPARLFLPALDASEYDQPLELEIWLRVHVEIAAILPLIMQNDGSRELETVRADYAAAAAERNSLQATNRKLQGELYVAKIDAKGEADKLSGELAHLRERLANSFEALNDALDNLNNAKPEDNTPLLNAIADLERKLLESAAANEQLGIRQRELEAHSQNLQRTIDAMVQSRSWRLTSPLRKLMGQG